MNQSKRVLFKLVRCTDPRCANRVNHCCFETNVPATIMRLLQVAGVSTSKVIVLELRGAFERSQVFLTTADVICPRPSEQEHILTLTQVLWWYWTGMWLSSLTSRGVQQRSSIPVFLWWWCDRKEYLCFCFIHISIIFLNHVLSRVCLDSFCAFVLGCLFVRLFSSCEHCGLVWVGNCKHSQFAVENTPWQMHYLLLFQCHLLKTYGKLNKLLVFHS